MSQPFSVRSAGTHGPRPGENRKNDAESVRVNGTLVVRARERPPFRTCHPCDLAAEWRHFRPRSEPGFHSAREPSCRAIQTHHPCRRKNSSLRSLASSASLCIAGTDSIGGRSATIGRVMRVSAVFSRNRLSPAEHRQWRLQIDHEHAAPILTRLMRRWAAIPGTATNVERMASGKISVRLRWVCVSQPTQKRPTGQRSRPRRS